jgi:tetratricopeptide (TPR) repeat protein
LKYYRFVFIFIFTAILVNTSVKGQSAAAIDSLKNRLSINHVPDSNRLKVLLRLASILRSSATSDALIYGHQALILSDSLKIAEAKGSALQILGLIYNTRMDYRNSLFYSFQALRVYETMGIDDGMAYAYNAVGLVYYSMKKQDLAKQYYAEAIRLFESSGNHRQLSIIYNNMGNVLTEEGKLEESLQYYKQALQNDITYNDSNNNHTRVYINIGDAFSDLNLLDSATHYLNLSLKENTGNDPDNYAIASCYHGLGRVELKKKNIAKADVYLHKALKMAEEGDMRDLQLDVYKTMILLYRDKRDAVKMYEYTEKYDVLKNSIYNETTVRQINDMQEAYQVEKRDREIQLLNQKQKVTEVNAVNQRLVRNFAIAALLLLLVIALVIGRNIVLKQRVNNRMLSEKNVIAEKNIIQLNHENVLAKYEAMKSKTDPHFLFNSLTTLSSIVIEDPKQAVKYIKQFSQLFRMVLEIGDHETVTLLKELEVINSYIYLQKIRFGESLNVSIDINEEDKYTLIPPFALQMLVENAVKHNVISQHNSFYLKIYSEDKYIVVRNTLRKKSSQVPSTSTGQKSVKERYRILGSEQPEFIETETEYIVRLPLLQNISILNTEETTV